MDSEVVVSELASLKLLVLAGLVVVVDVLDCCDEPGVDFCDELAILALDELVEELILLGLLLEVLVAVVGVDEIEFVDDAAFEVVATFELLRFAARLALVVVYCRWILSILVADELAVVRLLVFLVLPDWQARITLEARFNKLLEAEVEAEEFGAARLSRLFGVVLFEELARLRRLLVVEVGVEGVFELDAANCCWCRLLEL